MGSPVPDPVTHEVQGQLWLLLIALGGGWSLKRLIGGTGWFVGALVAAAAATALGVPVAAPAPALADTAQLLLGWSLGSRFRRESLARLPRLLVTSTILNVAAIGASALLGLLLAHRWGLSENSAILGAIPGGIAEMCITAASLGEPVAIVAAFHVVRVLGLLLLAVPLLRRITKANN
ncbi:AbrB family transcriptional regulator [Thiobacillus denitrificans]|nr:AbrB family transcriptional regulator [Thiobacillus denitrificans]MDP3708236.1 AbrB family transcriptional regulator [Polaromonas sp.]